MSLHVIVGCMFSGKSTELLRLGRRYALAGKKVLYINHKTDVRYRALAVTTHDGLYNTAMSCVRLSEINDEVTGFEVVLIDESQFFPDVEVMCETWANSGKVVIAAALSGTCRRQPFENVTKLMAAADTIQHLKAVCHCGSDASFTHRKTPLPADGSFVGGADDYEALCRRCFNET